MMMYKCPQPTKMKLLFQDFWTDLIAAYNKIAKQEEQFDPNRKEWVKSIRKMRQAYRRGEIEIYDADPEKLFSEAIKNNLRVVTADLRERTEPKSGY